MMRYSDKVAHGIRVIQLPTWSVAAGAYLARVSKQKHATEPVQLVPRGASHLPICLTTALALWPAIRTRNVLALVANHSEFDCSEGICTLSAGIQR
jgi:hypothetical protein